MVLVATLTVAASAVIFAEEGENWAVYMTVTTAPNVGSVPGEGYHFGFGARAGASNAYDAAEGDKIAPPDPQLGINAYFYYSANPSFQKNLVMSVTSPAATITWPLAVRMVGETGSADMTISWPDISNVPSKYAILELQDTQGITLADMRSVDHYTFPASEAQTYDFSIIAISKETPHQYSLAISGTTGGSVTEPGEGSFDYDEGEVVELRVAAEPGLRFVGWTGDVDTIADVNAPTTTVTVNGNYSLTANFERAHPPVNWPLIGGIIAAVVAVGLAIFVVRRRKRAA